MKSDHTVTDPDDFYTELIGGDKEMVQDIDRDELDNNVK